MSFRLINKSEYDEYSEKIKLFESQFEYPLGDQTFKLSHGALGGDYFSFFKYLGKESFFILEIGGKTLGAGCVILREVENKTKQKFFYLCDFKLDKSMRGKNVLIKLLVKYLLPFYFKSQDFVAINMSPPEENWLVKKLKSVIFFKKTTITPVYFYEWTREEYLKISIDAKNVFDSKILLTNFGSKDIVIDGNLKPIIHIVDKEHASKNLTKQKHVLNDVEFFSNKEEDQPIFMLSTTDPLIYNQLVEKGIQSSYTGTMITSKGINTLDLKFSSLEI
jgi:hypothetical protein